MKLALSMGMIGAGLAAPAGDVVESLPGWDEAFPSTIYSGFLNLAGSEKQLHYMFVEAEAPLDPATAPLVLWLNGGPGCSSLEGFVYEHGPFLVGDAHAPVSINYDGAPSTNTNTSKLVRNPWSWSRAANMLYLEAPAGVGFSYSTNENDYTTGDDQTAADNLLALQSFFKAFPEYQKNNFYVSGESYGGVYVPTLSQKIYQAGSGFLGNMRGYLVGNGVFDGEDSVATHVPFSYGHGFLSTKLHDQILATCDPTYTNVSPECESLLNQMDSLEVDVNPYDAQRNCYHPTGGRHLNKVTNLIGMFSKPGRTGIMEYLREIRNQPAPSNLGEEVPCINGVRGTEYLNRADVRKALHVDVSPNSWQVCGGVDYNDDGVYPSMVAVHQAMKQFKPRVLVYNGDTDPGCNYLWAEKSVERFGGNIQKDWHPWVYSSTLVGEQLGGFVTNYENDVNFATIHGAGHMSPQWRPEAAYNMFRRFLNSEPL